MRSDAIEEALQELLGSSAASQGLVITLRRHDEYEVLIERIQALEAALERKELEIRNMSEYARMYLHALDELRFAVKLLEQSGYDVSFVTSFRSPRRNARA